MRLAALRRVLAPAVAAALLLGAPPAGAQLTAFDGWAPSCGPGTPCASYRFTFRNLGASTLQFDDLSLSFLNPAFRFAPTAGGAALYQAVDGIGPFGGVATVAVGGVQSLVDFAGGGFPFELGPGATGYVEVPLASTPLGSGYFDYSATLATGGVVAAVVTPEPATVALLGGGLVLGGLLRRRRRAA